MAENMNNLVGRKVFFINPSYTIRNMVIPELRMREFEIYMLDDFSYLKNLLRHSPTAICLVCIDGKLSVYGWYALVESIKNDPDFANVTLGVLSDRLGDTERQLFLERLDLPAGAINTSETPTELTESISDILTFHSAKGRRQHVRVNCMMDKNASIIWLQEGRMYEMKMLDISVVGAALFIPPRFQNMVHEKTAIHNATLKIGKKQFVINFNVYGIHQKGPNMLMVTSFTQMSPVIVDAIKEYVYEQQQVQLLASINGESADPTDYAELGIAFFSQYKNELDVKRKEEQQAQEEAKKGLET